MIFCNGFKQSWAAHSYVALQYAMLLHKICDALDLSKSLSALGLLDHFWLKPQRATITSYLTHSSNSVAQSVVLGFTPSILKGVQVDIAARVCGWVHCERCSNLACSSEPTIDVLFFFKNVLITLSKQRGIQQFLEWFYSGCISSGLPPAAGEGLH